MARKDVDVYYTSEHFQAITGDINDLSYREMTLKCIYLGHRDLMRILGCADVNGTWTSDGKAFKFYIPYARVKEHVKEEA